MNLKLKKAVFVTIAMTGMITNMSCETEAIEEVENISKIEDAKDDQQSVKRSEIEDTDT